MNSEQIKEYNTFCVEFLEIITDSGYWVEFNKLMPNYITMSYSKRHHIEQLCFHSDWNWIMEMVEAIEKLEIVLSEEYKKGFLKNSTYGNIIIDSKYDPRDEFKGWDSSCSIELESPYIYDSLNYEKSKFESKKEAVVSAIYQFLKWYNENKK